jgi:hypothetical protein
MIDDGNQRDRSPESGAHVPQERPDPDAARRKPGRDAVDRPGADLGGAVGDRTTIGSNIIPGGPPDPLPTSTEAGNRPTGHMQPTGSSTLGDENRAGSEVGTAASGDPSSGDDAGDLPEDVS